MKLTSNRLFSAYSAKALVLVLLLWSEVVQAQKTALIQVLDNLGNFDTVRIGMAPGATKDVDLALGEADFTGIPWRGTEIRSVNTPQMCFIDGLRRTSVYLAQLKLDLRDSVNGMREISSSNPALPLFGWSESEVTNNSFYFKVRCGAPPCEVTLLNSWPFDPRGQDYFLTYSYDYTSSGVPDCVNPQFGLIVVNNQRSISYLQDTSMVVSLHYFSGTQTSLAKSFSELGMRVEQGYLVNTSSRIPQQVAVVDAMGRVVHSTTWPAENRMAMPVLPRGVYLYRIAYADRLVNVRVLSE